MAKEHLNHYDKGKEKWVPQRLSGKESTYSGETQIQSLGQKDPLEKEMATPSNILSQEIPWTEEPVGATVLGVTRVGHDLVKRQQHQDPLSWGWESYPLLPSHCPLLLLLLSHFSHV